MSQIYSHMLNLAASCRWRCHFPNNCCCCSCSCCCCWHPSSLTCLQALTAQADAAKASGLTPDAFTDLKLIKKDKLTHNSYMLRCGRNTLWVVTASSWRAAGSAKCKAAVCGRRYVTDLQLSVCTAATVCYSACKVHEVVPLQLLHPRDSAARCVPNTQLYSPLCIAVRLRLNSCLPLSHCAGCRFELPDGQPANLPVASCILTK